jgi:hypothetical protein
MATAVQSIKRQPRTKKADQPKVTTIAFPAMAEEHLDIPTLETWLTKFFICGGRFAWRENRV